MWEIQTGQSEINDNEKIRRINAIQTYREIPSKHTQGYDVKEIDTSMGKFLQKSLYKYKLIRPELPTNSWYITTINRIHFGLTCYPAHSSTRKLYWKLPWIHLPTHYITSLLSINSVNIYDALIKFFNKTKILL